MSKAGAQSIQDNQSEPRSGDMNLPSLHQSRSDSSQTSSDDTSHAAQSSDDSHSVFDPIKDETAINDGINSISATPAANAPVTNEEQKNLEVTNKDNKEANESTANNELTNTDTSDNNADSISIQPESKQLETITTNNNNTNTNTKDNSKENDNTYQNTSDPNRNSSSNNTTTTTNDNRTISNILEPNTAPQTVTNDAKVVSNSSAMAVNESNDDNINQKSRQTRGNDANTSNKDNKGKKQNNDTNEISLKQRNNNLKSNSNSNSNSNFSLNTANETEMEFGNDSELFDMKQISPQRLKKMKDDFLKLPIIDRPKKPKSGFQLYSMHCREHERSIRGMSASDQSRRISMLWKQMSDDERYPFESKAKQEKVDYRRKIQQYNGYRNKARALVTFLFLVLFFIFSYVCTACFWMLLFFCYY